VSGNEIPGLELHFLEKNGRIFSEFDFQGVWKSNSRSGIVISLNKKSNSL